MSQAWKNLERTTAKILKGKRIPRGSNFSKSLPDVLADSSLTLARSNGVLLAECKYSAKHPWVTQIEDIYDGKLLSIKHEDSEFLFLDVKDLHLLADPARVNKAIKIADKTIPKYILDYHNQAAGYTALSNDPQACVVLNAYSGISISNMTPMLPIVVMAKKGKAFRLACVNKTALLAFYTQQNDQSYRSI